MNNYSETSLANGLRVITNENLSSDVVTLSAWIRCGSRYESNGQLGYAHLLEHMLSKGTKNRPTSFAVHVDKDRYGASYNALTGSDYIYFVIQVTAKHVEKMFELLADIVLNPIFNPDTLTNEIKVVLEELSGAQEDHTTRSWIISTNKFFANHPLAHDPWGKAGDITKATSKQLIGYHSAFFIPNRAAIVVSGNLSHDETIILSQKYFGEWLSKSVGDKEDLHHHTLSDNYWFEKADINKTYIVLNYLTPDASRKREIAALNIIANYLNYGQSSLLSQELRNKKGLIYNLWVGNAVYSDAGRFAITTSTLDPEETIKILLEKIENLLEHFNEDILEEIKIQKISVDLRLNANQFNDISYLGHNFILYNRLVSLYEYIGEINKITYRDITEVASRYLTSANRFLFVLGPKDVKNRENS